MNIQQWNNFKRMLLFSFRNNSYTETIRELTLNLMKMKDRETKDARDLFVNVCEDQHKHSMLRNSPCILT